MVELVEDLRGRWLHLCGLLHVDEHSARVQFGVLVAAHSESHRHYHDLSHLAECFAVTDTMADLNAADRAAVEMAIWFHDVIYDPRATDNEQRSAEAARRWLSSLGQGDLAEEVGPLIEMTAGHEVDAPAPAVTAVHDADLAVLGAPDARYGEYCAQIRREYAHLDDASFARGRSRVLRSFLATERIYLRPDIGLVREQRARTNLTAELARLER